MIQYEDWLTDNLNRDIEAARQQYEPTMKNKMVVIKIDESIVKHLNLENVKAHYAGDGLFVVK